MIEQSFKENSLRKSKVVTDILACQQKDASGLNDFQKLPTEDLIAIPRVGINRYRLPIEMTNKFGETRSHDCEASMYVNLDANKNGVSMSRLCTILQATASTERLNAKFFQDVLRRYRIELADEQDNKLIDSAYLKIKFFYPVKQKSLRSDNWGWQYYPVELKATQTKDKGFEYFVTIGYEYSSTCPCSLSMAKQYENDFAAGKISEGSGIGVPHSQRSQMKCTVKVEPEQEFFIEDLVLLLKEAIPTETQSLVKRQDEQAFAILNGTHPMFVEHATKRVYKVLNGEDYILDWLVELEHLESLHSHNAAAVIFKGVENGLQTDTIF
ncbi:MAG: GTP cyclohydrolase [Halobacteriovoraceae bacterium]|nr:GTP cyclohydrolase [Halobacteriovoraceae bacterium]|tara:strand:+ start:25284 stop:26261 length:978 start_codon:yes stop_codon:yes gene_type:complete